MVEVLDEYAVPVRASLDAAPACGRRRQLSALDAASGSAGFDAAITAADMLIQRGDVAEMAAVGTLARRLADGTPPPADNANLSVYDALTTVNAVTGEIA